MHESDKLFSIGYTIPEMCIWNLKNFHFAEYDFSQFFLNNTESGSPEDAIKLDQAVQPEKKRHIIGNAFIRAKDLVMKEVFFL